MTKTARPQAAVGTPMARSEKVSTYAILTVVSAILMAPFVYMVSIALASDATTKKLSFTFFPTEFEFGNFVNAFTSGLPMGNFLLNSTVIVFFSCIGMTLSSAIVAYGFARLRAPGKNIIFFVLLATMMIPAEVLLIPQFVLFRSFGWVDTLLPLIIPNFFANAYNVFLMRQFISRVPRELDEAAMLDGLNHFGIFRRITLPLMKPVIIAVAIFTFTFNWGYFLGPLIYINTPSKMPLALGIQALSATSAGAQLPPWNIVMVGAIILTIPMLLIYYFGQKYLYEGGLVSGSAGLK